jgi:hypothetical protein
MGKPVSMTGLPPPIIDCLSQLCVFRPTGDVATSRSVFHVFLSKVFRKVYLKPDAGIR